MAACRLGLAKDVKVSYDWATFDGRSVEVTAEMRAYTRAFGYSFFGSISKQIADTMKELRRTSSDHKDPVVLPKGRHRVEPRTFDLPQP